MVHFLLSSETKSYKCVFLYRNKMLKNWGVIGGIAAAVAAGVYVLWGPITDRKKKKKGKSQSVQLKNNGVSRWLYNGNMEVAFVFQAWFLAFWTWATPASWTLCFRVWQHVRPSLGGWSSFHNRPRSGRAKTTSFPSRCFSFLKVKLAAGEKCH